MTSRQSLTSQTQGFSELPSVFYIPGIKMRTDNKKGEGENKKALTRTFREGGKNALAGYLGNQGRPACDWPALEQNFQRHLATTGCV